MFPSYRNQSVDLESKFVVKGLIPTSSDTEHDWFCDRAYTNKVDGYLRKNVLKVSQLSLWQ